MDMITLKNVVVLKGDIPFLNGASLTISDGITFCYGGVGCGKTTLCETVMGITEIVKGTVEKHCKTAIVARNTDLLSQLTLTQNIKMLLDLHDSKTGAFEILKMFDLDQVSGARFTKLTPLQKALAKLACAVASDAELIICDDLEAGLNTQDKHKLYNNSMLMLRREHGYSFLIVSGDNNAANIADKQYKLSDGKITEVRI